MFTQKNNKILEKIIFGILIFLIPVFWYANTFTKTIIQGVWIQYVTYDVWSELYNIKVGFSHEAVPLEDLAQKYNGITAINWVFFCPDDYSQCDDFNHTINERFVEGQDLSFYPDSGERAIFWWDSEWVPLLHQTGKINPNDRDIIYEWMGNFPVIFANGFNKLQHYHNVGLYDSKMAASAPRHFVCSNKEKTQIIFGRSSGVSLDWLAPVLEELWCWDALNLDAGNSSHFSYNNRKLISGKRNIIDGFVIERVWLDTSILEWQLDMIMESISPSYTQLSPVIAKKRLTAITGAIANIRHNIYVENSVDIFDTAWNIIWYEIQADELSLLKRLYLLNGLERRLQELREEL